MVRKSVHTAILFSVVIGAVMTALGIGMARPVLVLLDPPADTLADSIVYLQWYFAGMIPSMVYNMGAGILRAVGDSSALSTSSSSARLPTQDWIFCSWLFSVSGRQAQPWRPACRS